MHDRRCGASSPLKNLLKSLRLSPLGDAALYAEFADGLDLEINRALQALAAAVRARGVPWIRDVVPAICGIALHFDPAHPELPAALLEQCEALLRECFKSAGKFANAGRLVQVPVCYEGEFALDLAEVSGKLSIPASRVVEMHCRSEHLVLMVGFSPGQPYLGGLDAKLAVPRRANPRTRLPAGSVAIANAQTAVYSYETPGGWNVIGRTPLVVFDPAREAPSLFAPGDRVRFTAISADEYRRLAAGRA